MTGIVDWASERARMTVLFIIISVVFGLISYFNLPKEGEPDIEIPAIFISVPAPGISAQDSERLIVEPLESRLSGLTGLDEMFTTASDGYGGIALQFDYGWDREAIKADIREEMSQAESILPDIVENYSINEINFSEFPIVVISISGDVPERSLVSVARDLQDDIEALTPVLSAELTGMREELVEVTIDLQRLETYDITADELIGAVVGNNQLVAAGQIESGSGVYSIKIPSSFDSTEDVMRLPVKVSQDSVITLSDVADIKLTFEERTGTARYNGENTLAIQIVKRKGENMIKTVELVRETIEKAQEDWPDALKATVSADVTMDQSRDVQGMVSQLEASVITAIMLVMIAVLAALGPRSSLLVGFAIPTSFLLTFALLATLGISISNIVMFGLILAVGMLVDSAIVIVEYADQEVKRGAGPMTAYVASAKRMFWPVISSTATTLCAFLPLLLWPGVAGQFMGNLPKTIIFVLSASLVVAMIFLPVMGGVAGRISRKYDEWSDALRERLSPLMLIACAIFSLILVFLSLQVILRIGNLFLGIALVYIGLSLLSIFTSALGQGREKTTGPQEYRRSLFGKFIYGLVSHWWAVGLSMIATALVLFAILSTFMANNPGVEFFAPSEPERVNLYVQARGNLSVDEKDRLVRSVEEIVGGVKGVESVFAFAGGGGLNQNTGGSESPEDTIGTIQIELVHWQTRYAWPDSSGRGDNIITDITEAVATLPGIKVTSLDLARGPASAKPININLKGPSFEAIEEAVLMTRARMEEMGGIINVEDTRPLPGIDVRMNIDVTEAGRAGANVSSIGTMVRLATRGVVLGQMRVPTSDEEIDITVRLPKEDRLISTLETLRVRTQGGLVPISNFTSRDMVAARNKISRLDQERYYLISAGVEEGVNATERLNSLLEWFDEGNLPRGVSYELAGDFADQAESQEFLGQAFMGALGLMLVILLAQFNSLYNSFLVLTAVVFSTFGVLLGLALMQMPFSVIMTGTGVLALAGIIVNNNIILIDAYMERQSQFDPFEAITRTAESRIRPILLTAGTTILGVTPMMLGISIDFAGGGYTLDAPTSLWWKPLATAIVFGLAFGTFLTLIVTPTMLAFRQWVAIGFRRVFFGRDEAEEFAQADDFSQQEEFTHEERFAREAAHEKPREFQPGE